MRRDVRYGEGAIAQLPRLVAARGDRRVLLVCGSRSFEASGAARILPELREVAQVRRWSEFAPNPDAADLAHGLEIVARFRPDLVLAVGGGSAMDLAKLLCGYAGVTGADELRRAIRSGAPVGREIGLVLAPTTSGSGSEATHFAVVYIGAEKFSVGGPALRPDVAILDPALAGSGSRYQRASSGIDAVAQAIESRWAVAATGASRRWARHALGLLLPAIETYVHEPTGAAARAMAIGSHLAGRAIDISRTTAAHALSYGITQRYGLSHGHAVALTLGAFLAAHAEAAPAVLRPEVDPVGHRAAMAEIAHLLGAGGGGEAAARWRELLGRIGLDGNLPGTDRPGTDRPGTDKAGADRDAVRALARGVNVERLGNNPVVFGEESLATLLESHLAG